MESPILRRSYFDWICIVAACHFDIPNLVAILYPNVRTSLQSLDLVNHDFIDPGLIQNDVWLVAQTRFGIWSEMASLDAGLAVRGPKRELHYMVGLFEERLGDAQALKNLDGAALNAICLADFERARTSLQDLEVYPESREPNCCGETG